MIPNKIPKVSVCVVTYNQEKYIRQCLQSIVDQVTNFDFEVIVGDDCSSDKTREIVKEFAENYPDIVKPIFHEQNMGPCKNFTFVHQQAKGEYIAHVDGDDYCLPGKLQAQVDVLDSEPRCNIVWHRMLVDIDGEIYEGPLNIKNITNLKLSRGDLIKYMAVGGHSSKMYRKSVREFDLPDFEIMDYFTNVEHVRDGYASFIGPTHYGVYRLGLGIASSGSTTKKIMTKSFLYFYNRYPEYKKEVNTAALVCLIGDIKNRRNTLLLSLITYVRTFQLGSITSLIHDLNFFEQTRFKKLKYMPINNSANTENKSQ